MIIWIDVGDVLKLRTSGVVAHGERSISAKGREPLYIQKRYTILQQTVMSIILPCNYYSYYQTIQTIQLETKSKIPIMQV